MGTKPEVCRGLRDSYGDHPMVRVEMLGELVLNENAPKEQQSLGATKRNKTRVCARWLGSGGGLRYFFLHSTFMMKTSLALLAALAFFTVAPPAFAEEDSSKEIRNTSVVESGVYQVTASPEEKEIYVTTADGKTFELYFRDATKLTRGGQAATFDALKNGQKLEVQVEKDGNKLKPLSVAILE